MADRTTVNISKPAHKAAKQDKRDDESWSDWFVRKAEGEDTAESPDVAHSIGEDISEIKAQLNTIERAQANTVEDALSEITVSIDASERSKIAREVVEQLR
jgi:hypothetical protein